jgi:DNA primase
MSDLDITDGVLAELRSAADIVEVIGEHTKLKKAGRSWKGLCPFHRERTPSFTVDRDKGLYHCFGCGVGGDVIHFVRQIDRLDFPEAVEALAGRFGVRIPRRTAGPRDDRREKLLEALAAAHRVFQAELARPGNKAEKYLAERGVSSDLTRRLALGYAPDSWDSLQRALAPAFGEPLMIEAGLLQSRSEGKGAYDRFRDRLIFVVRDERGRPVGFGGRTLSPDGTPKYLNSPESPVFLKKRLLYGLSDGREAIRRRERAVLVEGYFDHLALVAAGIEETVASMGTALTAEQAEKLKRLAPRVIVCYDGDSAGRAATHGALKLLLAQGFETRVVRMPDGKDPHDVLSSDGPARLGLLLEEAPDYLTWILEDVAPSAPGISSAEKGERVGRILEILRQLPDTVVRHEECRRLAGATGVPLEVLWDRIRPAAGRREPAPRSPASGTAGNAGALQQLEMPAGERRVVQILLSQPELNSLILSTLKEFHLTHPLARRLIGALQPAQGASEVVDFQRQIADLTEAERSLVSEIALEEQPPADRQAVEHLLMELERRHLERESAVIQREIDQAEAVGGAELADLIRRKEAISRRKLALPRGQRRKGNEIGD